MSNCDCVERLNGVVKAEYDPEGYVVAKTGINLNTGGTWKAFPPLYFRYRAKNAKGGFSKKWVTSFFRMNFCPSCGKAIK